VYRNNGDGTFTDVSDISAVAKARGSYAMTAVAAYFDNDGWPDIYAAYDSTELLLSEQPGRNMRRIRVGTGH
jgi:hypothetical protein